MEGLRTENGCPPARQDTIDYFGPLHRNTSDKNQGKLDRYEKVPRIRQRGRRQKRIVPIMRQPASGNLLPIYIALKSRHF
jgi:hypothetical protein